jgi:hypothetical protein
MAGWECPTKYRLFMEYRQAVAEWVATVNKLDERAMEFDSRVMDRIDELRFRALAARALYEKHVADDGCE